MHYFDMTVAGLTSRLLAISNRSTAACRDTICTREDANSSSLANYDKCEAECNAGCKAGCARWGFKIFQPLVSPMFTEKLHLVIAKVLLHLDFVQPILSIQSIWQLG